MTVTFFATTAGAAHRRVPKRKRLTVTRCNGPAPEHQTITQTGRRPPQKGTTTCHPEQEEEPTGATHRNPPVPRPTKANKSVPKTRSNTDCALNNPVIPGEDPIEYQHKLDELRADLRPLNSLEDSIVEQIADTTWRLKRLARIEAAVQSHHANKAAAGESNTGKDHDEILGHAFTDRDTLRDLSILSRYEGQLSRRFHRLTKELRDMRKTLHENNFRSSSMEEREHRERRRRKEVVGTNPDNPQPSEQTHRPQPAEESTTSSDSPVPKREPTGTGVIDSHRTDPGNTGQPAPKEAQN